MKIDVLGIGINAGTKEQILKELRGFLDAGKKVFIATPYSEMIVAAQKDEEFRKILNEADFALPDGIGILWAAHYLSTSPPAPLQAWRGWPKAGRGRIILKLMTSLFAIIFRPRQIRNPIPEQIPGAEFVWDLAGMAESRGESVFLLGGFGNTPELASAALKQKFPNLKIAGISNWSPSPHPSHQGRGTREGSPDQGRGNSSPLMGEARWGWNQNLLGQINSSGADFLFVALGPKRQEKWIHKNLPNLSVKLAIGLGGTFDYLAQKRAYRPKFWALAGLEWLWRLLTQPWRICRIMRGVFGLIYYTARARMGGH